MPQKPIPPHIRFMRHVRYEGDCWIWTGTRTGQGRRYGSFQESTSQHINKVYAHRFAYETWVGPIPDGLEMDHVKSRGCSGGLCVNPHHLEAVTHAENMRRARLAFCRSGKHDLSDPTNVRWDKQGNRRGCQRCWLDRAKERYHRRKVGQ